MPIYRTNPTADFVQITNTLADTPMEFKAKDVVIHLLSKPPSWKVIPSAIAKALDLSEYIVKKSLTWLSKHGYAIYQHCHTGYGQWHIFDKPQPKNATAPTNPPKFVKPTLAIAPTLEINKETVILKKQQHEPTPIDQQKAVVVFLKKEQQVDTITAPSLVNPELIEVDDAGLEYPVQLNPKQKKAAKSQIKKAPIDLQQAILACLAHYMIQGTVKNPVGYLKTLVAAANNGTFEVLGVTEPPKRYSPDNDPKQAEIAARRAWTSSKPEVAKVGIAGLRAGLKGAL